MVATARFMCGFRVGGVKNHDALCGSRTAASRTQGRNPEGNGRCHRRVACLSIGRRGKPSFDLLQRIAGYFNIIWDEAEELFFLAGSSDPKVVIDTIGLPPQYTAFANRLARDIRKLSPSMIEELSAVLQKSRSCD